MKFLIALMVLVTLASAEYKLKTGEDFTKNSKECATEHNMSTEQLDLVKKGEHTDDETVHCYYMCLSEKMEVFDKVNGYNVHNMHAQLHSHLHKGEDHAHHVDHNDELHGKLQNCVNENPKKSSDCEWAYRAGICMQKVHMDMLKSKDHAHHHHHQH